jgi:hypothetical protein
MSGGLEVTGSGSAIPAPGQRDTPPVPTTDGNTLTHKVSGPVSPNPHLNSLKNDQTKSASIGDRKIKPDEGESTPGLKETKEKEETPEAKAVKEAKGLEGMSEEQLKSKQAEKLKEAGKLTERYETHSLLGRAKSALGNPNNAPKDLKVTVALPGKQPVTLIPWDKSLEERDDIVELMDIAKKVLDEYEEANFKGYKPDDDFQKLSALKDGIRVIASKLHDDKHEEGERGGFKNDWEKGWNEVRFKPVRLEAFEGLNRSDRTRVVAEPLSDFAQEQLKKSKESESESKESETTPENVTGPQGEQGEESAPDSV